LHPRSRASHRAGQGQLIELDGMIAKGTHFAVLRADHFFRRIILMRTFTPPEHREGIVARTIEQQTAKLPSDTFLWLAGASIATSLTLKIMGRERDAVFVGQWAPTFLLLGVYNKIVKVAGSD